jgi:hypothetical protein
MTASQATLMRCAALVVALVLTGCASGTDGASPAADPPVTSASVTAAPVGTPSKAWVAVLDTAADPARLTAPRKDVLRELGDVLEGSVVVSPGACLEGLPADLADGYVLAIQRDTRPDVIALVSLLSSQPLFTGDVTIVCSD